MGILLLALDEEDKKQVVAEYNTLLQHYKGHQRQERSGPRITLFPMLGWYSSLSQLLLPNPGDGHGIEPHTGQPNFFISAYSDPF